MEITRLDNQQLQRIEKAFAGVSEALKAQKEVMEAQTRAMNKIVEAIREEKDGSARQDRETSSS